MEVPKEIIELVDNIHAHIERSKKLEAEMYLILEQIKEKLAKDD